MKRLLHIIILLAAVATTATAQTIGEAFYIYRNDGGFNAFFRDEVQSIEYSNYDAEGNYYDEVVTQVVNTPDSIYMIPLAAIDSVGFVQPETVYKEGSVPLEGALFDYLIKVDGTMLTFDAAMPDSYIPHVGQKLVATDITEKLPNGFVGLVTQVSVGSDNIKVSCDNIELQEAVSQFYGVYEVMAGYGDKSRARGSRKAMTSTVIYNDDLPFGRMQLPSFGFSAFLTEKNTFDINYNNTLDIAFTPNIRIKITRVVDDYKLRSHTNFLAVTDVDVETAYDIAGEASTDLWDFSFLPKQDFLIAGIPVYFDIGTNASLSGEIAAGFTIDSKIHQVTEVTYFDVSLLPLIGQYIAPIVNRVDGSINITTLDIRWDYLGFRAEFKPCVYMRVGLSAISHVAGWVGGEFEAGIKANGELMFDINRIRDAEPGTAVYDELKDLAMIDVKPFIGAHFVAAAFDDRYKFELGKEFDNTPLGTWYQGRLVPGFFDTKAVRLSDTKARVTANITNDCFIPYTVGFTLYDEDKNLVDTELYGEKFWTRNAFKSFSCEFDGLDKTKKYKAYPIIRFFGKYNMLASPSADLDMHFPVTLSDFKVTSKQHKENGFTHNGQSYDYCFNVSITATLDDDAENIAEWGYVYLDPNGQEAFIPLSGHSYTDTRWAYYRNEAKSTCTLYGYVKYVGNNEVVYGEPHDYPLEYGETTCPDSNHPHWIDLGLPSGTQWRCCNEGASTPEAYGGYYTFGQVSSAPTLDQIKEFLNNTTSVWTTQNGVNGFKFTSKINGGSVFLPAAGLRLNGEFHVVGSCGYYWSSTPRDEYNACGLSFDSSGAGWGSGYGSRYYKRSVRPVR